MSLSLADQKSWSSRNSGWGGVERRASLADQKSWSSRNKRKDEIMDDLSLADQKSWSSRNSPRRKASERRSLADQKSWSSRNCGSTTASLDLRLGPDVPVSPTKPTDDRPERANETSVSLTIIYKLSSTRRTRAHAPLRRGCPCTNTVFSKAFTFSENVAR